MRPVITSFLTLIIMLIPAPLPGADWQPATAPLMTPWSEKVDPGNVLPEYPRPQMRRMDWQNLNGLWEFEEALVTDPLPGGRTLAETILVPFPWESALSGIRRQLDSRRAFYRRTFEIPAGWAGQRILLHFEAVDWEASVFINGRFAGEHRGGYDPFSFDITPHLSTTGPQEVIVRVYDPGNAEGIAVGKQANDRFDNPQRYTYAPSSGIWLPVWLEPVPEQFIADFHATPSIGEESLEVTVSPDAQNDDLSVEVIARTGATVVGTAMGSPNLPLTVPVPRPRLWWPNDPFLYDLDVILKKNGEEVDRVTGYFGMRKISLGAVRVNDRGPVQKLFLNNRFVFQMGPLDQGFWPDGLYTHPTDEALRWDVEQIKAWGFNMIRKHIKVESRRWFYHCDRAGLLVWQDMPSTFKKRTESEKAQFELELSRMVRMHWNSPCIVNWIVFNEHWGAYDVERLTNFVMALDPSRMVTGNSGIDAGQPDVDYQVGHIKDNHHYRPPTNPHPAHNRATVNGEYGAIGYLLEGHVWDVDGPWVHYNYEGREAATEEYVTFVDQLLEFKSKDALSGAVYTQWTDLENEMNGLYTYDRKVEKLDRDRVTAANRSLWEGDLKGVETTKVEFTNTTDGGAAETPD
ncbi:MAG: glycoside hydrolase family 2 TIM barrel-domain containing protein [Opitutaceae bacterium]